MVFHHAKIRPHITIKLEGTHIKFEPTPYCSTTTQTATLTITCDLEAPKHVTCIGYANVILCTKFEHFGFIRLWVMLRTSRQKNRRTRTFKLPTPTDRVGVVPWVGVSNYKKWEKIYKTLPDFLYCEWQMLVIMLTGRIVCSLWTRSRRRRIGCSWRVCRTLQCTSDPPHTPLAHSYLYDFNKYGKK